MECLMLYLSFRSQELSAALRLYQQAAGDRAAQSQLPEAHSSETAEALAEASLKLAFLCNELLQVSEPQASCMNVRDTGFE